MSAFGGDDNSDSGDNWEVECASSNAQYWQRDDGVRLRHVDTNGYVSPSFLLSPLVLLYILAICAQNNFNGSMYMFVSK